MRVLQIAGLAILGVIPCLCGVHTYAQDARISVAAVTKYTGPTSSNDVQRSQDFLATLETQLATSLVSARDVDYLDRANLDALLRELNLSSASVFDQSTGAMRGLLGRLDLLIVIEASTPTTARVRVVDVETAAVKGVAICEAPTTILGRPSKATPECVPRIQEQTLAAAKARLTVKKDRLAKAEAERQAAQQDKAERERRAARQQQEADRKRAEEKQAARKQQAEADRERAAEEEVARKQDEEIEHKLDSLRPRYEEAVAQLSTETAHWESVRKALQANGLGLRADVQSALTNAQRTADRCDGLLSSRNPEQLGSCLDRLSNILYQLGRYR